VRKRAEMEDYIGRAISLIHNYVPPKPDQLQYLLDNHRASMGQTEAGKSELRFSGYYKDGDTIAFTYDPISKRLLSAKITSDLGPKDPVTLDAVFEPLPDGINHLSSTVLLAKKRGVEVKTRNVQYQKVN